MFIFLVREKLVARAAFLLQKHNNLELLTGVQHTKQNATEPLLQSKSLPEHSHYTLKLSKHNNHTYSLFFARLPEEWTILSISVCSGLSALWAYQETNSHYLIGHTSHGISWENSIKNQCYFPLLIKFCILVTWILDISYNMLGKTGCWLLGKLYWRVKDIFKK